MNHLSIKQPHVLPDYSGNGWSSLAGTVKRFFGDQKATPIIGLDQYYGHKKLILIVVDGFGWRFVKEYGEKLPLLRRVEEGGTLLKVTSQFPSTTSNCITSLTFDKPLGDHLLYEWNIYHPLADKVITPLRFSYPGENPPEKMLMDGYNPTDFFPSTTLASYLNTMGVKPISIIPKEYIGSSYNTANSAGAKMISYRGMRQGVTKLREAVTEDPEHKFFFFYVPFFDSLSHHWGPDHRKVRECGLKVFREIYEGLYKRGIDDTLLLITADHGQTGITPEKRIYIDEFAPEILPLLKKNGEGKDIFPAGGPRDLFLHTALGHTEEVYSKLKDKLKDYADILLIEECIKNGLFGEGKRLPELKKMMGEILILPFDGWTVWWKNSEVHEKDFRGHHGGLSSNEMEIPLFVLPL